MPQWVAYVVKTSPSGSVSAGTLVPKTEQRLEFFTFSLPKHVDMGVGTGVTVNVTIAHDLLPISAPLSGHGAQVPPSLENKRKSPTE